MLNFTKKERYSNVKTKYAIQKLNAFFDGSEVFSDVSTIEHICPENDEITFNIGNLIILEGKLNNEAGCLSYSDKRSIYERSNFAWINKFADDNEDWEESDIENRARELARIYYTDILNKKI